jgi:PKD repeat protein
MARFMHKNFFLTVIFCVFLLILPAGAIPVGTETRISFSADPGCMNVYPSSDSGWVVWEEFCFGTAQAIIAYNYTSGVQLALPHATLLQNAPNIRNNRVVWYEDDGTGMDDIYYADINALPLTPHKIPISSSVKSHPVVDGDNIVWQNLDPDTLTFDILMFNLSSGILYNLTPDTPASDQINPSIYGKNVVFENIRAGEGSDIFMNETGSGWTTVNLTPGLPSAFNSRPVINRNNVVWSDMYNISLSDLNTTSLITGDPAVSVLNPSVLSPYIVWKEDTSGGLLWYDVMLFDTHTSVKEQITNISYVNPDPETSPVLINPDSRVIWVDDRNGQSEIYMFSLGVNETCPVAGFFANVTEGPAPLAVGFSDTSTGSPSHWRWDFGDGTSNTSRNSTHTFSTNGIYSVRLISGDPYCRSTSAVQTVSVGTPNVNFSSALTEGIAPLTVAFNGTATGSPSVWLWEFGDGTTSTLQNPDHTYITAGVYTVNLSATNSYGTGIASKAGYITVKNGTHSIAFTNISGVLISETSGRQILTYNKTLVPDYSLAGEMTVLVSRPPSEYGWQNITFVSDPGTTFDNGTGNIAGSISAAILRTRDIPPTSFPPEIGSNLKMNYEAEYSRYSSPASLTIRVWEGTMSMDNLQFENIIHYSGFTSKDVAYTMSVSPDNLSIPSREQLNLSLSSDWVAGATGIDEGRKHVFVIARGYDPAGNLVGTVIKPVFAGNDSANHLEYFEADIPPQVAYMTTFAPALLSGSGNVFQLVTLTIVDILSSPSGTSSSDYTENAIPIQVVTQNATSPAPLAIPSSPGDTGKSAKIYANDRGVITQMTTLRSTDGLAAVTIIEGVTAKGNTGKPLSNITIKAVSPDSLPEIPEDPTFTIAGMAYDLQPDNTTFSPAISLNLTVPQERRGQDFRVKSYDETNSEWRDVPSDYDPETDIVTAQISHFCLFALFSRAVVPVPSAAITEMPINIPTKGVAPATPAATSIFSGAVIWIVVAGIMILIVVIYLYGRKKDG